MANFSNGVLTFNQAATDNAVDAIAKSVIYTGIEQDITVSAIDAEGEIADHTIVVRSGSNRAPVFDVAPDAQTLIVSVVSEVFHTKL